MRRTCVLGQNPRRIGCMGVVEALSSLLSRSLSLSLLLKTKFTSCVVVDVGLKTAALTLRFAALKVVVVGLVALVAWWSW